MKNVKYNTFCIKELYQRSVGIFLNGNVNLSFIIFMKYYFCDLLKL